MPKVLGGLTRKVHPNAALKTNTTSFSASTSTPTTISETETVVKTGEKILTVWKKSLLMSCSGFTVFDSIGNLVYRVDNYIAGSKSEILLMDASGNPLFTIRRKRLSLGDNWLVYEGETVANPRYSARKYVNFRNGKSLAQVSVNGSDEGSGGGSSNGRGSGVSGNQSSPNSKNMVYEVEGSYGRRSCVIYDRDRRCVAEIKRKEPAVGGADFGNDVFRLVVQLEMDSSVAMAVVILIDQMFEGSSTSSSSSSRR